MAMNLNQKVPFFFKFLPPPSPPPPPPPFSRCFRSLSSIHIFLRSKDDFSTCNIEHTRVYNIGNHWTVSTTSIKKRNNFGIVFFTGLPSSVPYLCRIYTKRKSFACNIEHILYRKINSHFTFHGLH